jgi:hypothetical protein
VKRSAILVVAAVALIGAACSSSRDAAADTYLAAVARDEPAAPPVAPPVPSSQGSPSEQWLVAFATNLSDPSGGCLYSDTSGCDIYTAVFDAATGGFSDLHAVADSPTAGEWFPSLSADGCWVAYNSDAGNHTTTAMVTHIPTGKTYSLGASTRFPDWAPDGSAIAWASSGPTPQNVFLTPVEADCATGSLTLGAPVQVTSQAAAESRAGDPDFFPGSDSLSLHIDGGKSVPSQAAVINADGTGLTAITPVNGSGHTAVRPDGNAVVAGSSQAPILTLVEREGEGWAAPRTVLRASTPAEYAAFDARYAACTGASFYYPAWLDSAHLIYSVTCNKSGDLVFSHLMMTAVSGPGAPTTVDLGASLEALAGVSGRDFITSSAIPLPIADGDDASSAAAEWQPGTVYVQFVSHNEEPNSRQPDYLNNQAFYLDNRETLVELVNLFAAYGVAYDFQTDWNFLQAVARYDVGSVTASTGGMNVIQWMASMGVSIDPHAHESKYNYADVAALIASLGVEPSAVVGGFLYQPVASADWERFLDGALAGRAIAGASWDPAILWGAATGQHQGDDDETSGVWRPADAAHFSTDDPSSDLVYVGNCTSTYEGLEQLIGDIESARVPAGGFYTASIMLGQGTFDSATVAEVEAILEQLAAEVASGRVVYATLPEVVEVWEEGYGAEPSRYACE